VNKKSILATLMCILIVSMCTLTGCSSKTSSQSTSAKSSAKQYTIGVLIANMPDPFYVSEYYGFVKEAKALGNVKLIEMDAGGYQNVSKQVNQIDELISDKVDAIAIAATSPDGTEAAVNRAWKAGIPVICFTSLTKGKIGFYVGSSQQQLGEDQAKYMIKTLNSKGNVVMINGPAGVSWSIERAQAFKEYMSKYPDIHILAEKWGPSDRITGLNTLNNLLQTFPNINGVYTGSDYNGCGAAASLVAAGKSGKIVLTTAVMEPDTENYIKQGVISMTAAQRGVSIGVTTLKDAIAYLQKKSIPAVVSVPDCMVTKDSVKSLSAADLGTLQPPASFKP